MSSLLFVTLDRITRACIELVPALLYVHPDYLEAMEEVIAGLRDGDADGAARALSALLEKTDGELLSRLEAFPSA